MRYNKFKKKKKKNVRNVLFCYLRALWCGHPAEDRCIDQLLGATRGQCWFICHVSKQNERWGLFPRDAGE